MADSVFKTNEAEIALAAAPATSRQSWSTVHAVVANKHLEVVRLLVEQGAEVQAETKYNFIVGETYKRKDIYRFIGIPEDTKGGNWDTGYNKYKDD